VIILFEAIYYIPDAEKFVEECARVLRLGGKVLIATANKDFLTLIQVRIPINIMVRWS